MLKHCGLLFLSFIVSGCAITSNEQHKETINAIHKLKTNVVDLNGVLQKNDHSQQTQIHNMQKEIKKITSSISVLEKKKSPAPAPAPAPPPEPRVVYVEKEVFVHEEKGKPVLGEVEWLWVDSLGKNFKTRIDTGATTSSLNAANVQEFERDGKKWVRFQLLTDNLPLQQENEQERSKENIIEAPLTRWVKIRQASTDTLDRRAVVELRIRLGPFYEKTEFTLADRSYMEFPVLLGREFFRDIAIVDVSRSYIYPEYPGKQKITLKTEEPKNQITLKTE